MAKNIEGFRHAAAWLRHPFMIMSGASACVNLLGLCVEQKQKLYM